MPAFPVKVENGRVLVDVANPTRRTQEAARAASAGARPGARARAAAACGNFHDRHDARSEPRFSGSDHLLNHALEAAKKLGAETRLIRLNDLKFRACEGYFSKSYRACTWPCSITQMDSNDQLDQVYEAFVHWADAIIVTTPIRWGAASSLYYKMVERLNCMQVDTHETRSC